MNLSLGFSPCPNDCFIFDALIHNKINTGDFTFKQEIADVEKLNMLAFDGSLDITKLSFHAYMHCVDKYELLTSGSALGSNCGPLVISKDSFNQSELNNKTVAIPGKYTTANFLFTIAFPGCKNKIEMLFSDIEEAVLNGTVDAGVIIHENRFTYEQKGLKKIIDLGEFWEQSTKHPIPLGGIAIKRSLPADVKHKVNDMLRASVQFAFDNPKESLGFIKQHSQTMDEEVMYKHIELYVNEYSLDLGEKGKEAIEKMLKKAVHKDLIKPIYQNLFIRS
jgi:1,4-dihydroxy-6-naphthoate synthase